ncbi:MAG: N-methyl-L-tryptophan oxidase [Symploca sp. SIO2D2]|nr:N-methyl-L-tryptophan oxidase [Symploca sp. SIO2D2]
MNMLYDVIIVGLGAVGSATAYQLSGTNKKVLGIDQFQPPHTLGSSHGDTRITRQAIGEGKHYVPLVLRSHQIWRELESKTNTELFQACGGLIFGTNLNNAPVHGSSSFLEVTVTAAKEFGIEHQVLDCQEMQKRYPQFHYQGTEIGYFEPGAGLLKPEKCIETQLKLAKENGVELQLNQKVVSIEPNSNNDGVVVKTNADTWETESVIIAAGAWVSELLPESYKKFFKAYRQIMLWFEPELPYETVSPEHCPIYIRLGETAEELFYGFPGIDGEHGGIKIGIEQFCDACTVDTIDRNVSADEIEECFKQISKHLKIKNNCLKSAACLYTVTPDYGFVIDTIPGHPQILVASPCSGHGFKHSAAIGQILTELALNQKTDFDISAFSLSRFSL